MQKEEECVVWDEDTATNITRRELQGSGRGDWSEGGVDDDCCAINRQYYYIVALLKGHDGDGSV